MHVIVPVKRFELAKQRLAGALDAGQRRQLACAMLRDVLGQLARCRGIDAVLLVSDEPALAQLRPDLDFQWLRPAGRGLNEAVTQGLAHLDALGATRTLVMHADLPLVRVNDLEQLLGAGADAPVVLVPDRRQRGTNALLLDRPLRMAPQFGPDSLARHQRAAAACGLRWRTWALASLALDIDEEDDLDVLRQAALQSPGSPPEGEQHTLRLAGRWLAQAATGP